MKLKILSFAFFFGILFSLFLHFTEKKVEQRKYEYFENETVQKQTEILQENHNAIVE